MHRGSAKQECTARVQHRSTQKECDAVRVHSEAHLRLRDVGVEEVLDLA
jgi:hypothetical protein